MRRTGWPQHAVCGASSTYLCMKSLQHQQGYTEYQSWVACLSELSVMLSCPTQCHARRPAAQSAQSSRPHCVWDLPAIPCDLLFVPPGVNSCCCGGDIACSVPGHACKGDDAAAGLSGDTDDEDDVQKTGTPEPTEAGGESLPTVLGCWDKLWLVLFFPLTRPLCCVLLVHT